MTRDILNKTIEEICEEYSDEGLIKLFDVLKDPENKREVMDELFTRDAIRLPGID